MDRLQKVVTFLDTVLGFVLKNHSFFIKVLILIGLGRLIKLETNQIAQIFEIMGMFIYIVDQIKFGPKEPDIDTE